VSVLLSRNLQQERWKLFSQLYGIVIYEKGGFSMQCAYSQPVINLGSSMRTMHRRIPLPDVTVAQQTDEIVYLVDKDYRVRDTLTEFLKTRGIRVLSFASARQYLDYTRTEETACLILDLNLPDMNGLDLQRQLAAKSAPPIIFISSDADIRSSVEAIKAGAIEFLMKPINLDLLRIAVQTAFARDKALRKKQAEFAQLEKRFSRLTPREREVFPLVVGGLLNKQAASLLGISEITLQIHRSQVMRKMEADSLADLVRLAIKLRVPDWRSNKIHPNTCAVKHGIERNEVHAHPKAEQPNS
jgi:FixJ family two-component response regulator